MTRRRLMLLVPTVGLIVAACGPDSVVDSSAMGTTTAPQSSSTRPDPMSGSESVEETPFDEGRPTRFEARRRYRLDSMVVPIEVVFEEQGWYSDVRTETFVAFLNQRDESTSVSANLVFRNDTTPAELEEGLRAISSTIVGPTATAVAGIAGVRFDVEIAPQSTDPNNSRDHPCDNAWRFWVQVAEERGESSQWDRVQLGSLPGCGWSRVWLLEVGDQVVVMNVSRFDATTAPLGTLEEILPFADDLSSGLSLCVDGGAC